MPLIGSTRPAPWGSQRCKQAQRQDAPAQICRQHSAALLLHPCQGERRRPQSLALPLHQLPDQPPRLGSRALQDGWQRTRQVGAWRRNRAPLLLAQRQASH